MLFYSGYTASCGEVHDGDTVMDFMPQERERGITIKAAAITFGWRGHTINLIDTPGHVDFTVEVERAVRVLDGGVALYDAVAGVQAQSETVWTQARRHGVPVIGFVNKMDREGASFTGAAASIQSRLGTTPLLLQLPVGEAGNFAGVVDLTSMELITPTSDCNSRLPRRTPLADLRDMHTNERSAAAVELLGVGPSATVWRLPVHELLDAAGAARTRLIEELANFDDAIADAYLTSSESGESGALNVEVAGLQPQAIRAAIRRAVCGSAPGALLPLLCGTAYRNAGVQCLLDAVIDFLPNPRERPAVHSKDVKSGSDVTVTAEADAPLRALAFKVQNHPARGPMVFFRVYSGVLSGKLPLLNVNKSVKERPGKLLQLFADDTREVEHVAAGNIGAATGLKSVCTGDTLCLAGDPHPVQLPGVPIPPPVFTAAVEVSGPAEQKALEEALAIMTREDPSLHVSANPETGQLLISGMGELHLEIAADRLRREYNIAASLGKPMVAFKECVNGPAQTEVVYDRVLGNKRHFVKLAFLFERLEDVSQREFAQRDTSIRCRQVGDEASDASSAAPVQLKHMPPALADALRDGVAAAFERGPLLGYPVAGVRAALLEESCEISPDTTPTAVRACVARCFAQGLQAAGIDVLEPNMAVEITVPDAAVGEVLSDLSSARRGKIKDVAAASFGSATPSQAALSAGAHHQAGSERSHRARSIVHADVPLREMVGYSTWLRSHTAGEGTFTMEFAYLGSVGPATQRQLVEDPLLR